jgi:hypothetical protein
MTFQEAIARIPAPGGGGCHSYLMAVANIGVREGLDEDEMLRDIRAAIPPGGRVVRDQEILQAIRKAAHDRLNGKSYARPAGGLSFSSMRCSTTSLLGKILHPDVIEPGDFLTASPVQFDQEDGVQQLVEVLTHLYGLNEYLFLGRTHDAAVYTVQQWLDAIRQPDVTPETLPPHMIWNPMTGFGGLTKEGKTSYRCDSTIAEYRFVLVEFDKIDLEMQLRFWAGCRLPVAALVFSGGKSVHGILRVPQVRNRAEWNVTVRDTIFARWLVPFGVDASTHNPSRLARCPGAFREEKGTLQRLLYLNPAATPLYLT